MHPLRLVFIADTHSLHDRFEVPDGDVLVHAGDLTSRGRLHEVRSLGPFFARLPHREKVVVAGNHDFLFEKDLEHAKELLGDVTYLHDDGVTIDGLAFWGSPWQPWFHDWAFNLARGPELAAKWALIPDATDILVTHGPPHGVLDRTIDGERVGCEELTKAIARVRPRLHAFGHIHEDHGHRHDGTTLFVNASTCNLRYQAVQPPIVVDWDADGPRVVTDGHR